MLVHWHICAHFVAHLAGGHLGEGEYWFPEALFGGGTTVGRAKFKSAVGEKEVSGKGEYQ